MAEGESIKKLMKAKQVMILVACAVLVGAVATSVYFYQQYQHSQQLLQNPTLVAQQQTAMLVSQVGKLIELPKDETPTIATVSDVTKLQGQPFFINAKNGDKVLIYTKARTAILYDPVANKIVNVAPVNLGNNNPVVVSPTPIPSETVHKVTKVTAAPTK